MLLVVPGLLGLAACSSRPRSPTAAQEPGRDASASENRCEACIAEKVPREVVHPEAITTARDTFVKARSALDTHQLALAMHYLEVINTRFGDTQYIGLAKDEVIKHAAQFDAYETDCMAKCRTCNEACTDVEPACTKYCVVELPGR